MIPGIVFGGLALIAFALCVIWLCAACCCHCWRGHGACCGGRCRSCCCGGSSSSSAKQARQEQAQFISAAVPQGEVGGP
jgi:hypothetical protein